MPNSCARHDDDAARLGEISSQDYRTNRSPARGLAFSLPVMTDTDTPRTQLDIATTWFLAARAMASAGTESPSPDDASAGLYAQAILGLSEDTCVEAKRPDRLGVMTLVDCLSRLKALPRGPAEKIVTGALMIALADGVLAPLEVRWASMLASAAHLSDDDFQRCCASGRVLAAMLRPRPSRAPA